MSDSLTGPWSAFVTIYKIPKPWNEVDELKAFWYPHTSFHSAQSSYAPKFHPELARNSRELVVTFMSNTMDIKGLLTEPKIYDPQVLRTAISL